MTEPRWIDSRTLKLLHMECLAEHGGRTGLRNESSFKSALEWPRGHFLEESVSDLPRLAAGYAFGIARNHPFVDGNKRAAFLAAGLFLALNGLRLAATQIDAYEKMMALAAGELDEAAFAGWISAASRPK